MVKPYLRGKETHLFTRGLNVPLIVRWPKKIKAGTLSHHLISGEDIAPTLLEAAGLKPYAAMTGQSFLSDCLTFLILQELTYLQSEGGISVL